MEELVGEYIYTNRLPHGEVIVKMLSKPPKLLERQGVIDRIKTALVAIVDIFEW